MKPIMTNKYGSFNEYMLDLYKHYDKPAEEYNFDALRVICRWKCTTFVKLEKLCEYLKRKITGTVAIVKGQTTTDVLRQPLSNDFTRGQDELEMAGWDVQKAMNSNPMWY